MRFSLRKLFLAIALVAVGLGAVFALVRALRTDVSTETFYVSGQLLSPTWAKTERADLKGTVHSTPNELATSNTGKLKNYGYQELFNYKYQNGFGDVSFDVNYEIDFSFSANWEQYRIMPVVTGGGTTDGSAFVNSEFDLENKKLTLTIVQQFAGRNYARETKLEFIWDGESFVHQSSVQAYR